MENTVKRIPKISVIVPVYNIKKEYLCKCFESLLSQTLQDIEIVVVDDGSTDESGKVCDEYAAKDNRIQVIHQENQGVAVARNTALSAANGEWITFVDADDWCEAGMCEEILARAQKTECEILIFTNYAVKPDQKIARNQFFAQDIDRFDDKLKNEAELKTMVRSHPDFSFQPPENMMGGTWCKLIRHDFLKRTGIRFEPELVRSQDIIFYLNLFEQAGKIAYYDRPLYYYRYSADSVSKRYRENAYQIFLIVLSKQKEFIQKYQKPQIFQEVYAKGVMVTVGTCMRTDFMHELNPEGFPKKCARVRDMIRQPQVSEVLKGPNYKTLNQFQLVQKVLLRYNLVELFLILFKINGAVLKMSRR